MFAVVVNNKVGYRSSECVVVVNEGSLAATSDEIGQRGYK